MIQFLIQNCHFGTRFLSLEFRLHLFTFYSSNLQNIYFIQMVTTMTWLIHRKIHLLRWKSVHILTNIKHLMSTKWLYILWHLAVNAARLLRRVWPFAGCLALKGYTSTELITIPFLLPTSNKYNVLKFTIGILRSVFWIILFAAFWNLNSGMGRLKATYPILKSKYSIFRH